MDDFSHRNLKYRIDQMYFQVIDLHPNKRGDLMRMWKHAREIWGNLDKEMVNCRRLGKATAHYAGLESALNESLTTLEQYIMWASLLN